MKQWAWWACIIRHGRRWIYSHLTIIPTWQVFDFAAKAFARSGKAARGRSGKAWGTVLCKFFKGREEATFLAGVKAKCGYPFFVLSV